MKQYSRFITLVGGILAFFSFSLPWEKSYSGIELASSGVGALSIIVSILLGIIGISLYFLKFLSRTLGLVTCSFGLCFFLVLLTGLKELAPFGDRGSSLVTIAFMASLVVIGMIPMLNRQDPWQSLSRTLTLFSSSIGFCCFLILFLGLRLNLHIQSRLVSDIQFGAFLTTIGFILVIISVLETPKIKDNSEYSDEQKDKATH